MMHISEPPRLATGAAVMARRIDNDEDARPAYHRPAIAARHAEVERRYAWAGREKRKHHCSPDRLMAIMRVREITRWFEHRYGDSLPDDDAGRGDLVLFVNYLVQVNRSDPINAAVREAKLWAPWLGETHARAMAERALMQPIKLKADTLAAKLGVTDDLRVSLGASPLSALAISPAPNGRRRNGNATPTPSARDSAARAWSRANNTGRTPRQCGPRPPPWALATRRCVSGSTGPCSKSLRAVNASPLGRHLGHRGKLQGRRVARG